MSTPTTPAPAALVGVSSEEQFTAAYTEYRDMVRWTILDRLGSTRDADLAEDLTQETFLKLYRLRDRIEFDRPMAGLLKVMARQAITNHYRVLRNAREVPADMGHWAYANRNLSPGASGVCEVVSTGFRTARIGGDK